MPLVIINLQKIPRGNIETYLEDTNTSALLIPPQNQPTFITYKNLILQSHYVEDNSTIFKVLFTPLEITVSLPVFKQIHKITRIDHLPITQFNALDKITPVFQETSSELTDSLNTLLEQETENIPTTSLNTTIDQAYLNNNDPEKQFYLGYSLTALLRLLIYVYFGIEKPFLQFLDTISAFNYLPLHTRQEVLLDILKFNQSNFKFLQSNRSKKAYFQLPIQELPDFLSLLSTQNNIYQIEINTLSYLFYFNNNSMFFIAFHLTQCPLAIHHDWDKAFLSITHMTPPPPHIHGFLSIHPISTSSKELNKLTQCIESTFLHTDTLHTDSANRTLLHNALSLKEDYQTIKSLLSKFYCPHPISFTNHMDQLYSRNNTYPLSTVSRLRSQQTAFDTICQPHPETLSPLNRLNNNTDFTLLIIALQHSSIEVIQLIADTLPSINVNTQIFEGQKNMVTALYIAIYRGDLVILEFLVKKFPSIKSVINVLIAPPPLIFACTIRNYKTIEFLINHFPNMNINIQSREDGITPLIEIVCTIDIPEDKSLELINLLLERFPNIDCNLQDKNGFTAIMAALYLNKQKIVMRLLCAFQRRINFELCTINERSTLMDMADKLPDKTILNKIFEYY